MSSRKGNCLCGPSLGETIPNCSFAEFAIPLMRSHPKDNIIQVDALTGYSETSRQFLEKSLKVCEGLRKLGFGQNDIILLVARNSSDVYSAFLGVLWLGGTVMPVDFSWKSLEMQGIFKKVKPTGVICEEQYLGNITPALNNLGINAKVILLAAKDKVKKPHISFDELLDVAVDVDNYKPEPVESPSTKPAILILTSGTTGTSKAVEFTHRHLIFQLKHMNRIGRDEGFDNCLVTSHFYWITCTMSLIISLGSGHKRIYMSDVNYTNILNAIEKYKPQSMIISPASLSLIGKINGIEKYDFSCFKVIFLGGSQLTRTLLENIQSVWKTLPLVNLYGCSEVTGPASRTEINTKLLSIGKPLYDYKIKIIDTVTGEDLGPHETGEICISSPGVMLRYANDEEITKAVIDGEWYHTGDLGYYDETGYVYFVGRIKEMIKNPGNFQITPTEIEGVIEKIPGVSEAGVVGVFPEADKFELIAVVVKHKGSNITEDEIKKVVKESLADYKQLSRVKFVSTLPRSNVGKMLRRDLLEMVG